MGDFTERGKEILEKYNNMDFDHIDDIYLLVDEMADFITDIVYNE